MCNLQASLNINFSENHGDSQEMSPSFSSKEHTEKNIIRIWKGEVFFFFLSLLDGGWFFFSLSSCQTDSDIKFSNLKDFSFIFSQFT